MKKLLLALILNAIMALTSWGQMNPIKNLNWWTGYDFGNCEILSWNKPDSSLTDTLVGYNIYHDDSLFSFTTDTIQSCDVHCGGSNNPLSFCSFLYYNNGNYYIHVTAVYNHDSIQSIYTDSIYNNGIAIGIKDVNTNNDLGISSIIQNNSSLTIGLNRPLDDNGLLIVSNCLGQEMDKIPLPKGQQEIIINSPTAGFYFLNLKTNYEAVVRKIVVK
jgi:hypothetical protein